jgi:hypothetical protein
MDGPFILMTIVVFVHLMLLFHLPLFSHGSFDFSNQDDEDFVMPLKESSNPPPPQGLPTA